MGKTLAARQVRSRRPEPRPQVRHEARTAIADALDTTPLPARPKASTRWRLVLETQVWEDYGSRWKPKGGCEYHVQLGDAAAYAALAADVDVIARGLAALINFRGEAYEETVIGWAVYGDQDETPDEAMHREMAEWGYPDRGNYAARDRVSWHLRSPVVQAP